MSSERPRFFWQQILPRGNPMVELDRLTNDASVFDLPRAEMFLTSAMHILAEKMGFRQSAELGRGRFGDGSPAPMLSYSLLEYLMGLDLSSYDVLEIGGGESTEFWVRRVRSVTCFETDAAWAAQVQRAVPGARVEAVAGADLARRIEGLSERFHIIVIDPGANRLHCARAATAKLAPGGFVLLDNSDWYPNAAAALREADLIQVDFHDFRPCHHFRCTSSLFMSRDFRPKPSGPRLPQAPIGGKVIIGDRWDQP